MWLRQYDCFGLYLIWYSLWSLYIWLCGWIAYHCLLPLISSGRFSYYNLYYLCLMMKMFSERVTVGPHFFPSLSSKLWNPIWLFCSAHLEWNLDGLLEKIWEYLNLTRIYTKPKGMNPDYEDPVILSSKKRTVEDFCERIHKDMLKQFK